MSFKHPPPPPDDALFDDDNPEWTDEMFARAKRVDDLEPVVRDVILTAFPNTRLRGKQKAPLKAQVTLRLDRDVLDHFRAAGDGWQTRINAFLRAALSAPR